MKQLLFIIFTTISLTSFGQDKFNFVQFNKLTEVIGTEYVIASIENRGKMLDSKSRYLLFINSKTGQAKQVDLLMTAILKKLTKSKLTV